MLGCVIFSYLVYIIELALEITELRVGKCHVGSAYTVGPAGSRGMGEGVVGLYGMISIRACYWREISLGQ